MYGSERVHQKQAILILAHRCHLQRTSNYRYRDENLRCSQRVTNTKRQIQKEKQKIKKKQALAITLYNTPLRKTIDNCCCCWNSL